MPQCSGRSDLVDGGQVDLLCQSSFFGADSPTLEWFMGNMAIQSQDVSSVGTISKRVFMDATFEMDKANFTCRVSSGEIRAECTIILNVAFKY